MSAMSALLVWCLRIVEVGPTLVPFLRIAVTTHAHEPQSAPSDEPAESATTPWCGQIDPGGPDHLRRVLTTACLITVAYLTGVRANEELGLRPACCTPMTNRGEGSGGYEIRGRTYKSAVAEGRAILAGFERTVLWKAIKHAADAIAIKESLHGADLLFSATLFKARSGDTILDAGAPPTNRVRESIEHLAAWCNQRSHALGRAGDVIPPDPDGKVSLRRLRRTLAWFICRRPRGRVALGIQYGHLHAATADGYGGRVLARLRDLFPMEEAFAISDSLHTAAEHLDTTRRSVAWPRNATEPRSPNAGTGPKG